MSFIGGLIIGGVIMGFAVFIYIEGGFWYRG